MSLLRSRLGATILVLVAGATAIELSGLGRILRHGTTWHVEATEGDPDEYRSSDDSRPTPRPSGESIPTDSIKARMFRDRGREVPAGTASDRGPAGLAEDVRDDERSDRRPWVAAPSPGP